MYTKTTSLPNLYIRNVIPGDVGITLLGYGALSGGAMLNFAITEFYEVQQLFRTRAEGRSFAGQAFFASYASACISERLWAHSTTTKKIG